MITEILITKLLNKERNLRICIYIYTYIHIYIYTYIYTIHGKNIVYIIGIAIFMWKIDQTEKAIQYWDGWWKDMFWSTTPVTLPYANIFLLLLPYLVSMYMAMHREQIFIHPSIHQHIHSSIIYPSNTASIIGCYVSLYNSVWVVSAQNTISKVKHYRSSDTAICIRQVHYFEI